MTRLYLTELEAVNLCIDLGLPKAEKRLKTFHTLGKLETSSIKSLMADLLTEYKICELALGDNNKPLRGTNRRYILGEKRTKRQQREYKYKGKIPTTDDEIIKEYVFSRLVLLNDMGYKDTDSITGWSAAVEMLDTSFSKRKAISMFKDYYYIRESEKVVSSISERLSTRNIESLKLAFNHLEKENRIRTNDLYYAVSGSAKEISEEYYKQIKSSIETILNKHKVTYKQYVGAMRNPSLTSDKLEDAILKVNKMLLDKFEIKNIFTGVQIILLDTSNTRQVTKEEKDNALISKVIKLTRDDIKKKKRKIQKGNYIKSGFVEKEFRSFNIFLLLQEFFSITDLEVDSLEPTIEEIGEIQEIRKDFAIKQAEEWKRNNLIYFIEE